MQAPEDLGMAAQQTRDQHGQQNEHHGLDREYCTRHVVRSFVAAAMAGNVSSASIASLTQHATSTISTTLSIQLFDNCPTGEPFVAATIALAAAATFSTTCVGVTTAPDEPRQAHGVEGAATSNRMATAVSRM